MTPLLYWALETIEQTKISDGFTIVTTTDVACHQWLRHSFVKPKKHPKGVLVRGITMMTDVRFCFVAYEDLEQDEAGDTYTHTFTWLGWEPCQTRYFYFWATSEEENMRSTSPIFSKHYPYTQIFYPDPDPEISSVDGMVRRYMDVPGEHWTWQNIHDGEGNRFFDDRDYCFATFYVEPGNPPFWTHLDRIIIAFDTSSLPPKSKIISANLEVTLDAKQDPASYNPAWNVYSANPSYNNQLIPADYQKVGVTPFSTPIPYAEAVDLLVWQLNKLGIAHINKAGTTAFSIRECNYDVPNNEPPWVDTAPTLLRIWSREKGKGVSPVLTVNYTFLKGL